MKKIRDAKKESKLKKIKNRINAEILEQGEFGRLNTDDWTTTTCEYNNGNYMLTKKDFDESNVICSRKIELNEAVSLFAEEIYKEIEEATYPDKSLVPKLYPLWERENKIANDILEDDEYVVYLAGTDLLLRCENRCEEYHMIVETVLDGEIVDYKIMSLGGAANLLAREEEHNHMMPYDDYIETGLTKELCQEALNHPFLNF